MRAAAERPVTLVTAPAGYGKTTQVASWFRGAARPAGAVMAWLSVGDSENDPTIFLRYLVAALRAAGSRAGARAEQLLDRPGADPEQALASLINGLASQPAPTVLVFDDYHAIRESGCHELVAVLLERAPPTVSFVITSRSQPPLPLGSLRAAGRLSEVRERDLQLTPGEVAALVRTEARLDLDDAELAVLVGKTEGWAAALQLALLWLRHHPDRRQAIREFAGDHRHLADYLGEQVLAELAPETLEFLLLTSVLSRFSEPLCRAVLGDAYLPVSIGQLETANLFVVSLDSRREWFRYHHLFGGLLQAELRRRRPGLIPELHRRAYEWHRVHGTMGEAVHHAVQAGEIGGAADIIATTWMPLFHAGRSPTVRRWISMLSAADVTVFPELAYIAGITAGAEGAPEREVEAWTSVAERAIEDGTAPEGDLRDGSSSFEANVDFLHSAFVFRDVGAALTNAQRVVDREPRTTLWWVPGHAVLGFLHYLAGDPAGARAALHVALHDRDSLRRPHAYIHALATEALLELDAGDAEAARRSASRALDYATTSGLDKVAATGLAHVALGRSLVETGQKTEGVSEIEIGCRTLDGRPPRAHRTYALVALADAQLTAGDLIGAHRAADAAAELLETFTDAGLVTEMMSRFRRLAVAGRRRRRASPDTDLTETELTVLRLLAGTGTRRTIAAALSVSPNTIKTHTASVYRKLGISSREAAVARARDLKLI